MNCTREQLGRWLLATGALLGLAWATRSWSAGPAVSQLPDVAPPPRAVPAWKGSTSCAATACHGSGGGDSTRHSEYTIWATRDRHADAYNVLLEKRSQIIECNYRKGSKEPIPRPEKDPLCLRCHTTHGDAGAARQKDQPAITLLEGVGCERCHGSAEKWLSDHYSREWQALTEAEKQKRGFNPTRNLLFRAKVCAECHVGTRDADVDHDLIAAGHPRLNFELSAFQATMPPHWDQRAEKARIPDLEIRSWALGQLVSAEAAAQLLAYRAENREKPWPEFAEYECQACHQPLRASPPRARGAVPGTLPWGDWYFAGVQHDPSAFPGAGAGKGIAALAPMYKEMQRPEPDRARVQKLAQSAARQLGELTQKLADSGPARPAELRRDLAVFSAGAESIHGWDSATQRYLALAAAYHSLTDLDPALANEDTRANLRRLIEQLRFRPGRDTACSFDPVQFTRELDMLHRRLQSSEPRP
jgi:hypothetical protein